MYTFTKKTEDQENLLKLITANYSVIIILGICASENQRHVVYLSDSPQVSTLSFKLSFCFALWRPFNSSAEER